MVVFFICKIHLQRQGQKGDRSTLQKSKRIRAVSQAVLLNQEKAPHFVFLDRYFIDKSNQEKIDT